LWSAPLSLTVDSITLDLAIKPLSTKRAATSASSSAATSPLAPHIDLTASVTSAADDFVHDELDAFDSAELDRSIRESLVLSQTDPFADDLPGSFPPVDDVETPTVLAGIVQGILARLECRVRTVRVRVRFEDDHDKHSGVLELRVGEVRYADETPEEQPTGPRRRIRALTVSDVALFLLPLPPTPPSPPPRMSRSTSSSSSISVDTASTSSESTSGDEYHEMVMSQAVHDLRQSTMGGLGLHNSMGQSSVAASGMSIYHSIVEEEPNAAPLASPEMERVPLPTPLPASGERGSPSSSRTATPTPPAHPAETMLLSLGSEDIVIRITTASAFTPPVEDRPATPRSPTSPRVASPPALSPRASPRLPTPTTTPPLFAAPPPLPGPSRPSLDIELSIGTIAAVLLPQHVAFLLAGAQAALGSTPKQKQPEVVQPELPASPLRFDARVRVKGVYISVVYDMKPPTDEFYDLVPQFFARPSATFLPLGHLRLRLEGIVAAYSVPSTTPPQSPLKRGRTPPKPASPSIALRLADASVFEYLASAGADANADEPPGGAFPVLIFDANLSKQYDVAPGAYWGTQPGAARSPADLPSFPEFEAVDWRNAGNAGAQKRNGEKAWRVRPKGKGILRGPASPERAVPAIAIRKELSDTEGELLRCVCELKSQLGRSTSSPCTSSSTSRLSSASSRCSAHWRRSCSQGATQLLKHLLPQHTIHTAARARCSPCALLGASSIFSRTRPHRVPPESVNADNVAGVQNHVPCLLSAAP
jgi:autophagy-related protein 2